MDKKKGMAKYIVFAFLLLIQIAPIFINVNVSLQLFFNSFFCVTLGSLCSIIVDKEKDREDRETLKMKDALSFPVKSSIVLFSLYLLLKKAPISFIMVCAKIIFFVIGSFSIQEFLVVMLKIKNEFWNKIFISKQINLIKLKFDIKLTRLDFLCYIPAFIIAGIWMKSGFWLFSNLIGISLAVVGLREMSIDTYKTVFTLLWLLFVYDIFWVFGSDVMVKVATSFDVPIKLIFPRESGKPSILGLGDIVVPGMLIVLNLKFDTDHFLAHGKKERASVFIWSLVSYALGMIATMIGMGIMGRAQPALLYLVPFCSLGTLIPMLINKEQHYLLKYNSDSKLKEKDE